VIIFFSFFFKKKTFHICFIHFFHFFLTIKMSEEQNQVTEISSKTNNSKIWNHFKKTNDKAKCNYCG
jgi:hypothetical protein